MMTSRQPRSRTSANRRLLTGATVAASAAILAATVACTAEPATTSAPPTVTTSAGAPAAVEQQSPATAPATPSHDPALDDDLLAAAAADDAATVRDLLARGADIEARGPHMMCDVSRHPYPFVIETSVPLVCRLFQALKRVRGAVVVLGWTAISVSPSRMRKWVSSA